MFINYQSKGDPGMPGDQGPKGEPGDVPLSLHNALQNEVTSYKADNATEIGVSILKYPRMAGETDDLPRFERAIDYLASISGGKLIIPKVDTDYVITATNPTIQNPRRVIITTDNIHIEGVGRPTIQMKGVTQSYIESIDDLSSSGRDVFNVFSFIGVSNCSVKDIHFNGEWAGTGRHRFASPRAKAVGFLGCTDCEAENLSGFGLFGNLINAVSSSETYDGIYKVSTRIKIINSHAVQCYENGFNFMGNTFDCSIINSTAELCGTNGFEGGSAGLTVSNNIFKRNKANGVAVSGTDTTINGNVLNDNGSDLAEDTGYGNGLQISYSSNLFTKSIIVQNNVINSNRGFGIMIYPSVSGVTISDNMIQDNARKNIYQHGIYALGTISGIINDLLIKGNKISDSVGKMVYGVNLGHVNNAQIQQNMVTMYLDKVYSILASETCTNIEVSNNNVNKSVVVYDQALNCVKYNNFGSSPKTTERNVAPTVGAWSVGDFFKNMATYEVGTSPNKYIVTGWLCTASGSPGTWKECRVLTGG